MDPEDTEFFLRKNDGNVYGPVDRPTLQDWASQGRVAPDDAISKDKEGWYPAPTLPDLQMHWMVNLPDGSQYGPVHLLALKELAEEGSVPLDSEVTNRLTEKTSKLADALKEPRSVAPKPIVSEATAEPPAPPQEQEEPPTPEPETGATQVEAETSLAPDEAEEEEPPAEAAEIHMQRVRDEWREIAESKDQYEKESIKWRKMYEDEHASLLKKEGALNERIDELRRSESAARLEIEQLERKLRAAQRDYQLLKQTVEGNEGTPQSSQLVALMEAYSELSQGYDSLASQVTSKSAEIRSLLDSRKLAEENAEEQMKRMEQMAKREREEAESARRQAAEMEETHLQLVKSYRDLNSRFIRLRQEASGEASPDQQAQQPGGNESSHGKVRLTRSRRRKR